MGLPQACEACLGHCLLFKGNCTFKLHRILKICIPGSLYDYLVDVATSATLAPGTRPSPLLLSPHHSPSHHAPWCLPLKSSHPGHHLLLPGRDDLVIVNHSLRKRLDLFTNLSFDLKTRWTASMSLISLISLLTLSSCHLRSSLLLKVIS